MKELKEMWNEMDHSERVEAIGEFFAFAGLFVICFMISVIFG